MKTLGEVVSQSVDYLKKREFSHPRRLVEEMVEDVLGFKRMDLYLSFDLPLEEKELHSLRSYLKRLGEGEPAAYIRGFTDFYGCRLKVDKRALIPRQETELLVDQVAKSIEKQPTNTLLDLCTGSGCIGIALKKKFPSIQVLLSDISEEALSLSKENSLMNEVEVTFLLGDFLKPFQGQKVDIIVCNPPYIADATHVAKEVIRYEPSLALFAPHQGLYFYEKLAQEGAHYLHPGGRLFLEIGFDQGKTVPALFKAHGWEGILSYDLAGHARFFTAHLI